MEENLISKKELLEITGISYGQLYRWKRKKLIPEEWFIKKSAFTGQETFFPKEEILVRIQKILQLKDGQSLDHIAESLKPNMNDLSITEDKLREWNLVSEVVIKSLSEKTTGVYSKEEVLCMYICDKFLKTGNVSISEGQEINEVLIKGIKEVFSRKYDIILYRKFGVSTIILIGSEEKYFIDKDLKEIHKESISKNYSELSEKISKNSINMGV